MLQEAGVQTSPEKVEVSYKEMNTPTFCNAWSIGEKYVDTSDLFLSQSPTNDNETNICVIEETIIDLTMSDEEDSEHPGISVDTNRNEDEDVKCTDDIEEKLKIRHPMATLAYNITKEDDLPNHDTRSIDLDNYLSTFTNPSNLNPTESCQQSRQHALQSNEHNDGIHAHEEVIFITDSPEKCYNKQQPQQLQTQQPQPPQIQQPQQPTLQERMPTPSPYAAQPIRVIGSSYNKRPSTYEMVTAYFNQPLQQDIRHVSNQIIYGDDDSEEELEEAEPVIPEQGD
ncbi:unnamed protein product [Mytilus edulis]|uniref:Uncharacterized protein n=1 Tax=Mytilus edulis TaxID=6550 RepID=A0A8S3RXF2_MYTED|nr:unnamed protein product [Mytilus edulis]